MHNLPHLYTVFNKTLIKCVYHLFYFSVPLIGVRHWQILLLFIMIFTAFGFRVTLSVAIVAMTDPKANSNPDIPVGTYSCKLKFRYCLL